MPPLSGKEMGIKKSHESDCSFASLSVFWIFLQFPWFWATFVISQGSSSFLFLAVVCRCRSWFFHRCFWFSFVFSSCVIDFTPICTTNFSSFSFPSLTGPERGEARSGFPSKHTHIKKLDRVGLGLESFWLEKFILFYFISIFCSPWPCLHSAPACWLMMCFTEMFSLKCPFWLLSDFIQGLT